MLKVHMISAKFYLAIVFTLMLFAHFQVRAGNGEANMKEELEKVVQSRIFFGHQSVGENVLDGLRKLSSDAGVALQIGEVSNIGVIKKPMFAHGLISENEQPLKKLISFESAMNASGGNVDIAFMKFCYVDFSSNTDVKGLFEKYQTTINALKIKHPKTTFVHVTTPLHVVEGGLKAKIKYQLGIAPLYGTIENLKRAEFNSLMRKTYQGKDPLFDLAKVESTRPDGSVESVSWQGEKVPVMVPEYTSDGGHLNEKGEVLAARELISVLAAIPGRAEMVKK